ncbi:PP2C family protein-serine/threonine phosphatase [Mucilaginibacter sp. E4BP6]|uniref:PP2C family protein-serine/threonine phosphatase n=1 Tax=Mucilaginibacter sp. E4BP6 TaxID=2723089 RepID=UPI0015CAC558|nr:protein phosphatase 2C domain-containing protein [Mucilaginibacter sp. E4BP6]NYE68018.1 serine/threonine protein phosphatase PrpC [Mucilaginibacter sp. E4BP6]
MTEQFFGLSDTGRQRENNEDLFIAQYLHGHKFILASVIDGVGGYAGGEVAAEHARAAIIDCVETPFTESIPILAECFHLANERIIAEKKSNREYEKMSCVATAVLIDLANNQLLYAHVGDTRLYLFRDGSLVKISHDQSFVGFLEESGRLTEHAAMTHPRRNEINKALGFEIDLNQNPDYIETGQSPFLPGDQLLLCTDGLSDMVNAADIASILNQPIALKEKTKLLIDMANENGGRDNVTVVLVQNDKTPQQYAPTKVTESATKLKPIIKEIEQPLIIEPFRKKKSNIAVIIFAILALIFLGTSVYLYRLIPVVKPVEPPVVKLPNRQEIKLQQAISNMKGKILILSDTAFTSPLIISKAIIIDKDSLLIKAKGNIIIQADTGYAGPALILTVKSKHVVLDSLSFSGFTPAIDLNNSVLNLKNVRFNNCKPAVRQSYIANKKYVSGQVSSITIKVDSLPVKTK